MSEGGALVLGAGPAGLAAAYNLAKAKRPVTVLEASPFVGGLARSFTWEDHIVDLGPHRFFTKIEVVNRLWEEVLGEDIVQVDRLTRIYYRGKFFYYPLKPWNAFFGLGPIRSVHAVLSYLWAKVSPHPDEKSFEGWVTNRFGKVLYETFFKTYTEKLWGIPCTEIGADWAGQRIKGLSLSEAIKNAFFGGKGNKVKTLVDRFGYPRRGTGMFYERMAERVREWGGDVRLGEPATTIRHDGRGRVTEVVTRTQDGTERVHPAPYLLSSMPLTLLIQGMDPPPPPEILEASRRLVFRNTILAYVMVDGVDLFPDNWIYVHAPEVRMGRLTNFRNWSGELAPAGSKKTPLVVEFWCFDEDPIWSAPDQELVDQAARELETVGLIRKSQVTTGKVIRLRRCYPVYKQGYLEHLEPIIAWLKGFSNLQPIGRYGAFKYNNQDHSLLMGILAARNVMGEKHDLWAVNTDTEYQEEIRLDPSRDAPGKAGSGSP